MMNNNVNASGAAGDLTRIAALTAAICVFAPFQIPIGPVPITLATFAVYVAAVSAGFRRAVAAVGIYIVLGVAGAPVFAGFSGGIHKLAGPTGGYIAGYLPCAAIAAFTADKFAAKRVNPAVPLGLIAGTVVMYALGTAWYVCVGGRAWGEAVTVCVTPFLVFDAVKIAMAAAVAGPLRSRIR
jgi:biotin transport system substrate-specific component